MEQVSDDSCELQQTAKPSFSTDTSPTRPGSIIISLKLGYALILKNIYKFDIQCHRNFNAWKMCWLLQRKTKYKIL